MTFKKITGKVHLWLGLLSGLLVVFLGITGCILAFQQEIESVTNTYRYVKAEEKPFLLPSQLKIIAEKELPGKKPHSVIYQNKEQAAQVVFYDFDPAYYYLVYLNPYSGDVLKVKNMDQDFFRIVIMGHYYLWLPPNIGQPIVASGTLIFFVMLVSGIILWWPRNKAARKQRFTIKWNVRWRRKNYDLHNVLGFYASWIAVFLAITGLVMGFQWFAKTVYFTASGGESLKLFEEPHSMEKATVQTAGLLPIDQLWLQMKAENPAAELIEVHYPETDSSSIAVSVNPDAETYWKTDYRYFDQYSLKELSVDHIYGRFKDASVADKIIRMNYDIHVGAVIGLPGKILAFFASLICASLPITGFYIWLGRRRKVKTGEKLKAVPRRYRHLLEKAL